MSKKNGETGICARSASTSSRRPNPPHRHLEGERTLGRVERDDLAVENQLLRRKRTHRLGHLRHRGRDVVQASRVDGDAVALLVDLNPGAIELPFDPRRHTVAELLQRLLHVRRGVGEHRLHRTEELKRPMSKPCFALGEDRLGHRAKVAGEHGSTPDAVARKVDSLGNRFRHHPFQRALPHLADAQREEELLFGGCRPSHEIAEHAAALSGGVATLHRLEGGEGLIDFSDSQRCFRCCVRRARCVERRPPDPQLALPRPAGEKPNRDRYLARGKAP
jgi:hypothetical protein